MTFRFVLTLPAIALLASVSNGTTALAETNAVGDEIYILGDDMPGYVSSTAIFSPSLSSTANSSHLPKPNANGEQAAAKTALVSSGSNPGNITSASSPLISSAQMAGNQTSSAQDLRDRIISGYAMPELNSQYTSTHESWYASRPDYVRRMMARSQKYLYHIVEEVEKRGMPTEIALLPMIESAFNPQANSTSRASGMWQFIPSTGKDFGLKQNWWVDNRRDVTAATNAALTYLQKLHVMFGTWELALAAYNAGEGTVKRAIERNQREGLPTDYVSLPLPPETRNYVPKLQAIKNIMTHPERYGLDIQPIANRPYFVKVNAPEQIDIKLAAKLAEISSEEFAALNPGYNRPVMTSSGNVHEILLPVSAALTFTNNLATYTKPLVSWQTYHAKRGERIDSIAQKFGIPLDQLRSVNDLPARPKLVSAGPLLVPNANGASIAEVDSMQATSFSNINFKPAAGNAAVEASSNRWHSVKNNETLAAIAKQYAMSIKQLISLNRLKNMRLQNGQKLNVITASEAASKPAVKAVPGKQMKSAAKKNNHYIVRRGDTLDSIAKKFEVARGELQRWNNMNTSRLSPGDKLVVQRPSEA